MCRCSFSIYKAIKWVNGLNLSFVRSDDTWSDGDKGMRSKQSQRQPGAFTWWRGGGGVHNGMGNFLWHGFSPLIPNEAKRSKKTILTFAVDADCPFQTTSSLGDQLHSEMNLCDSVPAPPKGWLDWAVPKKKKNLHLQRTARILHCRWTFVFPFIWLPVHSNEKTLNVSSIQNQCTVCRNL